MRKGVDLVLVLVLGAASLYLTASFAQLAKDLRILKDLQLRRTVHKPALETYSFVGADHPRRLPVAENYVKMTVQESAHFAVADPESELEWLWTATIGDGHVRLGDEKRMFAVAMFHQLHCLRGMRNALAKGWHHIGRSRKGHIHHCYNYLRQWTLCSADVTLEPGDFTTRNFTVNRQGATHTCIDWQPSYELMKDKWIEWEEFRVAHNIPWHEPD
ncbi:hypothetical protein P691DRAFT_758593 [Macrolepiota fuliginosa MF-IS2]|uniref:Uncharacterized protein n=1 Tax=Macrolepiota fuliginosa MF-IS2 TaxID=1400762 RepID=A0A9P5XIW1_9AGAR|nr:hypothetical protein P691DRAFT_758593 [Macrolepiota fuliginosa MF-IS2]